MQIMLTSFETNLGVPSGYKSARREGLLRSVFPESNRDEDNDERSARICLSIPSTMGKGNKRLWLAMVKLQTAFQIIRSNEIVISGSVHELRSRFNMFVPDLWIKEGELCRLKPTTE